MAALQCGPPTQVQQCTSLDACEVLGLRRLQCPDVGDVPFPSRTLRTRRGQQLLLRQSTRQRSLRFLLPCRHLRLRGWRFEFTTERRRETGDRVFLDHIRRRRESVELFSSSAVVGAGVKHNRARIALFCVIVCFSRLHLFLR